MRCAFFLKGPEIVRDIELSMAGVGLSSEAQFILQSWMLV